MAKDAAIEMAKKKARKTGDIEGIDKGEDKSKDEDKSKADMNTSVATNTAKAVKAEGSSATKAGGAVMAMAPLTGPAAPWVAGAGAGLMTVGAVTDAKNKQKTAEYDAKVERLSKQQNALTNLSALASRMKRL